MDALAALMRDLRFTAAGYRRLELGAPWALSFEQAGLRGIHIVAEGRCLIAFGEGAQQLLEPGDLVIAPRADPHVMRSVDGGALAPVSTAAIAGQGAGGRIVHGGDGERTVLLCGAFVFGRNDHPALSGLPHMVHVPGSDTRAARWMKGYVETLTAEALAPGPGSDVVLANLSAALVTRALRHGLEGAAEAGWLKGLGDPGIARVLAAIHDAPGESWTVERLARTAAQSRAGFARRFHDLVGEPPMRYVLRCRMGKAAGLLRAGRASLAQIAEVVGYGSEAAFSAAFRRHSGTPPGAYRRRARDGG